MLERAIAVINGKGGTGKTSITANLAGLFAAAGNPTLAVDLDPQGNLGRDLGYMDDRDRNDNGRGLFAAVTTGAPLAPLHAVRENLDVVCGGDMVEDMAAALHSRSARGNGSSDGAIEKVLAPIADRYSLVLLDCPPGNRAIQRMALAAAHYVVIPTKSDDASQDGLIRVADLFSSVRADVNPDLALLGVVLFGIGTAAKRIERNVRDDVARDLGDPNLVFDSTIRHLEGPAQQCRRLGLLVHEIEAKLPEAQAAARKARFAMLKARRGNEPGQHRPDPESMAAAANLSASAPGLATDYEKLAYEVTQRIAAAAAA